jgi:D-lactate dehydrogenase (cytochrome)
VEDVGRRRRCRETGAHRPVQRRASLEGHIAALEGGVCVDLTRMNRSSMNVEDMDVTVEAERDTKHLEERLRPEGLSRSTGADIRSAA